MLSRIAGALLTLSVLAPWSGAFAAYPDKPIHIVVAFTPGSGNDRVARIMAEEMRKELDVQIVVENRPGAAGAIGTRFVLQAPADGYTLLMTSSATHSANPWLIRNLPYDPVKDFAHITNLITTPLMLVVPHGTARTLQEFVEKSRKAQLTFGYGSSTSQVFASAFSNIAGLKTTPIAYKSQPPALTDLSSGIVQFMFADAAALEPFIKGNRLTALATTAEVRSPQFPDVPTLTELGYKDFDLTVWVGIGAAANTPREVVGKLSDRLTKILARDEVRQRFAAIGMDTAPNGAVRQSEFVVNQLDIWKRRIQEAGLKPE
ncbi:MAG: Bug family tripartite tricarboxylate transporter substrate binding protein [Burkholderiaceae bacterium]